MEPEVASEETGKRSGHRNKVSDILRQGSAVQVLQAWSKALRKSLAYSQDDSPEDFGRSVPAKSSSPTLPRARSSTDPGRMYTSSLRNSPLITQCEC